MTEAAQFALGGRFAIVNAVPHRPECPNVSENSLQVLVGQIAKVPPTHNLVELSGLDEARAHGLKKDSLVVVGDS